MKPECSVIGFTFTVPAIFAATTLSEDDGATRKYKRLIDGREALSYPDADFYDGRIYLTYDRERTGAKEILFTSFTEEDIMNDGFVFDIAVVSKP